MRAVDTNLLVRLVTGDDTRQVAAAEDSIKDGARVPLLALAESVSVLDAVYGLSAAQVVTAVEMLLDHENLTLQDAGAVGRALDLFRVRPSVGFSDCLILESARKEGHMPLGTFDNALGRVEGAFNLLSRR